MISEQLHRFHQMDDGELVTEFTAKALIARGNRGRPGDKPRTSKLYVGEVWQARRPNGQGCAYFHSLEGVEAAGYGYPVRVQ